MRKFALLLIAAAAVGQTVPGDAQAGAVASRMRELIAQREVPGAVTLVATAQGIVHVQAHGFADLAGSQPMRPDSIFWIASMTKPITATAILMLEDQGKLSVEDPVAKYIPELAGLKTKDGQPVKVTLRHLLTHTSGMAEATPDEAKAARKLADLIPAFAAKPLMFEPGSEWRYCQSGINTLSRVVEIVSGQPFEQFLEQRIFAPLGMKDTTFYLTEEQLPRWVRPAELKNGELKESAIGLLFGRSPTFRERFPAGNGGLFSTALDYAQFARMILNGGTLNGKVFLSPASVRKMTSIQTGGLKTGFTPGNGWGLAWCIVREPQGVTATLSSGTFGHGGAFGTQAWIDPARQLVHILMVQRSNFPNADDSPVRHAFHEAVSR